MVRNIVENHVVAFSTFSEILFRVINHVIRAERSDKINISGAANASNIRAESFRDLHRECAHASRRAVNQDLLTRLDFSFVAKSLQRRDARYVYRRDRKSTRLNSSHVSISYAVFCLKK